MWTNPARRISATVAVTIAATALFVACGGDPTSPLRTLDAPSDASFARSDATNGGAVGFNWISPIKANLPSYPGTFDATRASSVVVEVCKWVSNACSGPLVASFTGFGITVSTSAQSYNANWPTSGVTAGQLYRIRVLENGYELGFADAKKPGTGESISSLTAAQIVPLGNSSSLQIKFRLAQRVATQIEYNAGDAQTATAGSAVATAPSVIVKDANNQPLGGVSVTFAPASGGGSVTGGSATTNVNGIATVGSWTLGTTAGTNTLTASSSGLTGSPVTFTATGAAGTATQIALNAGDNQSATAGSAVATAPSVIVKDANNNPVAGVGVTFAPASGGGSVTGGSATTDASGIATVGSWTLGATAGANTMTATSGSLTGSPVTFNATGTVGSAALIAANGGDNQSATAGSAVATPPSVLVTDANNNPVSGVSVTFAAATGGGSVTGGSATTNASGIATVGSWTLGTTAGTNNNTMTATSGSLTGSPVTFTASATAGAASTIAVNGGNNQSAAVGTLVPIAPSVIVRDANNNPVSGINVIFAVASGGGSSTGNSATTNASGIATVGSWTLGTTAGTNNNTLTATSGSLTGSPVTFTASATAGAATQIASNGGDGQSASAGSAVAIAPSVIVRDANNNPVSGINVTFAPASGGGSVTGGSATTDASGIATVGSWTLGTSAGTNNNTLTATSGSLTGSPVTFTASATAGTATQISYNAGDGQTATVGTAVSTAPSVLVRDANNNPVAGVGVTFAVASGGGSSTGNSATTNASGIATVGSWTLGTTAGSNTLTATSGSLSGSPVTFTATGSAGAASSIASNGGNGQSATVGSAVATAPSVIVKDANNNPVSGVNVTFAAVLGGGSVTGGSATTNASGIATVGSWTLGTSAGTNNNTMTASSGSLSGSPVTFTASATAGAATQIASNGGTGQSATVGTAVATAPSVIVRDANNNPVSGVGVTFAVTGGGGSSTGNSATTNASGIATVGSWTMGTNAGTNNNTMTATSGSLSGSPVTFTASATAGAATQIASNGGTGQSASVGTVVPIAPSVIVRDANNNPVAGVSVTFAVTGGGGSSTGNSATTNASGIATVGSWTMGTNAGTNNNTMTATSGSLSGSPVTFTASATAGAAATIGINGGNSQSATVGTAVATAPSVIVRDANNNPVSGVSVTFAVASGGGSSTGNSATTNASGVATVGSWTLGTSAGTNNNTLTATSGSLSGSPVTFTASATAGAASSIAVNAGNNQSAIAGSNVAIAPSVIVKDANNNPVSGVSVTFTVTAGGGSRTGSPATTNASGIATVGSWTLGASAGTNNNTLQATSGSLSGSPVTFTASATVGPAANIAVNGGNGQSATVGSAVSTAPSVIVRDANGNAVGAGTSVTFAVTGGGGSVTGASASTNSSGIATVGSWTLGTSVGANNNTMTATSGTLTGSPVTFTASATAGPPSSMTIQAGDGQTANSGAAVGTAPKVRVKDASGNALAGVTVTFSVTGGGGSGAGFNATTDANGDATVTSWTLGSGGAGCSSLATIANCSRNRLHAVATGGSAPAVDFVANVPVFVPVAQYQTVGNVPLSVADGSTDLLSQAYSINGANGVSGGTIVATANTLTGTASGTAVVAANGSFSYASSLSVSGAGITETFTYVVSDGIATTNTNASLSVNIPFRVFYVQPGYSGTSTGTSAQPYKDFSAAAGTGVENVAGTAELILVKTGSGSATGGTLKQQQTVKGQGISSALIHTVSSPYRNTGNITLLAAGTAPQVANLVLHNIGNNSSANNTLVGLNIVGTSGTALSGTSFGTVTVSETSVNASGSASGLVLNSGTMSGSLVSVSSGSGAANGISLTSTINVQVLGSSSTAGSGGTIASPSGADGATGGNGIYISAATGTTLKNINVSNTSNSGVFATGNITGLTLDNIQITGINGSTESSVFGESAVRLANVNGSSIRIANSRFDGGAYAGISVSNTTTGSLDSLIIAKNTISTRQSLVGSPTDNSYNAMEIVTNGVANFRIDTNSVSVWELAAIRIAPTGTAAFTSRISKNTLATATTVVSSNYGIRIMGLNVTYKIATNTINNAATPISVSPETVASSIQNGTIDGNTIGTSGQDNSGANGGIAINVFLNGAGSSSTTKISNNVIRQIAPSATGAILLTVQSTSVTMNATVTGNNIQEVGSGTANPGLNGIFINNGTASGENGVGCFDIGGSAGNVNVITNFVSSTANNRIRVNERFLATGKFPGYTGANNDNAALQTYLLGRNSASTALAANNVSAGGGGNTNTAGGASCTQPTSLP